MEAERELAMTIKMDVLYALGMVVKVLSTIDHLLFFY
jgi:hypothetical protein